MDALIAAADPSATCREWDTPHDETNFSQAVLYAPPLYLPGKGEALPAERRWLIQTGPYKSASALCRGCKIGPQESCPCSAAVKVATPEERTQIDRLAAARTAPAQARRPVGLSEADAQEIEKMCGKNRRSSFVLVPKGHNPDDVGVYAECEAAEPWEEPQRELNRFLMGQLLWSRITKGYEDYATIAKNAQKAPWLFSGEKDQRRAERLRPSDVFCAIVLIQSPPWPGGRSFYLGPKGQLHPGKLFENVRRMFNDCPPNEWPEYDEPEPFRVPCWLRKVLLHAWNAYHHGRKTATRRTADAFGCTKQDISQALRRGRAQRMEIPYIFERSATRYGAGNFENFTAKLWAMPRLTSAS